jgi:hypothetical protein
MRCAAPSKLAASPPSWNRSADRAGHTRTGSAPRSRPLRLEQHAQKQTFVVSEEQLELLERHSVDFRCRHIEASRAGEMLNQNAFYWGTPKGADKVYVQVVIDVFCSFAFAKVYTSKIPVTACDLLYERVMPFYDEPAVKLGAVLTDNGREFCGRTVYKWGAVISCTSLECPRIGA